MNKLHPNKHWAPNRGKYSSESLLTPTWCVALKGKVWIFNVWIEIVTMHSRQYKFAFQFLDLYDL